jgi:hypothetical protein
MYTSSTAEIELHASGCVVARIRAGVRQSLADAQENLAATIAARGGRRRPLLIDISRGAPLEPEVRHYYSGECLTENFGALGLLIEASPLGRMMGNVFLKIARPGIPTKLFTDEPAAIAWLRTFDP